MKMVSLIKVSRNAKRTFSKIILSTTLASLNFVTASAQADSFPKSCFIKSECTNKQGISNDWAFKMVNADLAVSRVLKFVDPKETLKVAIIDSGYQYRKDVEVIGADKFSIDLVTDDIGHGTGVTEAFIDTISQARKHIKLSVYKVGEDGSTKMGFSGITIRETLLKACNDGNRILNLSVDGAYADTVEELLEKGCFVVQAGGNSGEARGASLNPRHPIYVGAVTHLGLAPDFSAYTKISAPGVQIALPLPHQSVIAQKLADKNLACNEQEYFISGTSFATPIVSAIVAMEFLTVQSSKIFKSLNNKEKRVLLESILIASSQPRIDLAYATPVTNALKAVEMAKQWSSGMLGRLPTIEHLQNGFNKEKETYCKYGPRVSATQNLNSCEIYSREIDVLRSHIALCEQTTADTNKTLFSKLAESGQYELASFQMMRLFTNFKNFFDEDLSKSAKAYYRAQEKAKKSRVYKDDEFLQIESE